MKDKVLSGYVKIKKRERFWRAFRIATANGQATEGMVNYANRLLDKKDKAILMFNRLFE